MTVDYLTDIRFGYGPIANSATTSTLSFPQRDNQRYPNLIASNVAVPMIFNGLKSYNKLADSGNKSEYKKAVMVFANNIAEVYTDNAIQRLKFTANSEFSFFERLVYFWQNHFAVGIKNKASFILIAPGFENEAIRPNVDGKFKNLLTSAVLHPAIQITLDQNVSIGPRSPVGLATKRGINENLGRELLELHTLGTKGGYTQIDVEQMSRLLTGLRVNIENGKTFFDWKFSEPGVAEILGKKYGGAISSIDDIKAAIEDLAANPSTARYICTKLCRHFISDTPPTTLINNLTAEFLRTDGLLSSVYSILIQESKNHAPRSKVKTPLEYIISALRALGSPNTVFTKVKPSLLYSPQTMRSSGDNTGALPDLTVGALNVLGHRLWGMPGPDGWPDTDSYWLNADGLAKRLAWAEDGSRLAPGSAQSFLDNALGATASPHTRKAIKSAPNDLVGVTLTLMSPDFNRR